MSEPCQEQPIQLQDAREFWFVVVDMAVIKDRRVSVYSKAIYAVLCAFADRGGRECWPTVQTIAETAGVSERTAQRAISQLIELGYVQKRDRFKANQQITSLYTIIGHKAAEKTEGGVTLTPPGCQSVTPGVSDSHPELEPRESLNNTLPTVEAEKPSAGEIKAEKAESKEAHPEPLHQPPAVPDEAVVRRIAAGRGIPEPLRATVEFFIFKTSNAQISEADVMALRELSAHHTPARVQKEISTAVERFKRSGRDVWTLTLNYIWQSLSHQPDTLRPRAQPAQKLAGVSAETRRRQEEIMKKLGV